MDLMDAILAAKLSSSESGAGAGEKRVTVSGTSPEIAAEDNTLYLFAETVTSITIDSMPSTGLFELVFLAGAAAPEIIGPTGQSISLAEGCEIAADQINDVSVRVCTVAGASIALATVGTWEAPTAATQEASA